MPLNKDFGGKSYGFVDFYYDKSKSVVRQSELRKRGYLTRTTETLDRRIDELAYFLWARKK